MDISSTVRVITSLVVVVFLLLIFLYYLRKFRMPEFSDGGGDINILGKKYLGPNNLAVLQAEITLLPALASTSRF